MFNGLQQHHIGCLVASIDEFKNENAAIWKASDYSEVYTIEAQDVKVCFIEQLNGIKIELVEPGPKNKSLARMLEKGVSYYHLAFTATAYDDAVNAFEEASCRQLSEFRSEAFNGKRCSFFYHPHLKLIELIESN
jgi:hypothetical protein